MNEPKIEVWTECAACGGSGKVPDAAGGQRCIQCAVSQPGRRVWPGYLPELLPLSEALALVGNKP